jgi:hypothetical protein
MNELVLIDKSPRAVAQRMALLFPDTEFLYSATKLTARKAVKLGEAAKELTAQEINSLTAEAAK